MASKARKAAGAGALTLAAAIAMSLATSIGLEGGWVNDPDDPGGETHHGVTVGTARADGYTGAMKDLTVEQATAIYDRKYVRGPNFDLVFRGSVALGDEITDTAINMGPHRPSCWFQTALNSLNDRERLYRDVKEDCRIGPATMAAWRALERKRGTEAACKAMLKLMDAQQGTEYLRLSQVANPTLEKYMFGWMQRIGNVMPERCELGGAL